MKTLEFELDSTILDMEAMQYLGTKWSEMINKRDEVKKMNKTIDETDHPYKSHTTLKKAICDAFTISEEQIFAKTRKREIVNARQVYIYMVLNAKNIPHKKIAYGQVTLRELGKYAGGIDHSTCIHSIKTVKNFLDTEMFYKDLILNLRKGIDMGFITMPGISEIKEGH